MPPLQTCRKLVIKRGSPMRTITALFVGLGSIGTRHLKNLTNLCADRGWTLQADALRSDLSRPLRDGVAALLHAQYTDLADAPAHYDYGKPLRTQQESRPNAQGWRDYGCNHSRTG